MSTDPANKPLGYSSVSLSSGIHIDPPRKAPPPPIWASISSTARERISTRSEDDVIKGFLSEKAWKVHAGNIKEVAQELKTTVDEFRKTKTFWDKVIHTFSTIFLDKDSTKISIDELIAKVKRIVRETPDVQLESRHKALRAQFLPEGTTLATTTYRIAARVITGLSELKREEDERSSLLGRVNKQRYSSSEVSEVARTRFQHK